VRQDKILEHRNHEGIGAVGEEAGDLGLEPATQGELSAENLVLGKDEKEDAHGDAKEGERECVAVPHRDLTVAEGPSTIETVSISVSFPSGNIQLAAS
jgi:hypothetical protein